MESDIIGIPTKTFNADRISVHKEKEALLICLQFTPPTRALLKIIPISSCALPYIIIFVNFSLCGHNLLFEN